MWTDKYVGIPYKSNGRDTSGLDCWGLVCLIYKQEYHIELPSFSEQYANVHDALRIQELFAIQRESWQLLDKHEPGSVILFRILGEETHVGVVVDDTRFIHVREGSDCVVDTFTSGKWANRVVGFYKYSEQPLGVVVNSVPHPLKTQRWLDVIEPGTTVEQLYTHLNQKYEIADELNKRVAILVNGQLIAKELWPTTILSASDVVEYRAVAGRDTLRLVAIIVIAYYLGPLAAEAAGTAVTAAGGSAFAAKVASAAAYAATVAVGGALVNSIFPIRVPTTEDPGQPEQVNLLTNANNPYNPYGAIPVILGKVRYTPPLGAKSYAVYSDEGKDQYLHMLLVWGYGPITIFEDTIKIGDVPWTEYEFNDSLPNSGKMTFDRKVEPTTTQLEQFKKIYGEDVTQFYVGIELTGPALSETDLPNREDYDTTIPYEVDGVQYQKVVNYVNGFTQPAFPTYPHFPEVPGIFEIPETLLP